MLHLVKMCVHKPQYQPAENKAASWAAIRLYRFQAGWTSNALVMNRLQTYCQKFETKLLLIASTTYEKPKRVKICLHGCQWFSGGDCNAYALIARNAPIMRIVYGSALKRLFQIQKHLQKWHQCFDKTGFKNSFVLRA